MKRTVYMIKHTIIAAALLLGSCSRAPRGFDIENINGAPIACRHGWQYFRGTAFVGASYTLDRDVNGGPIRCTIIPS